MIMIVIGIAVLTTSIIIIIIIIILILIIIRSIIIMAIRSSKKQKLCSRKRKDTVVNGALLELRPRIRLRSGFAGFKDWGESANALSRYADAQPRLDRCSVKHLYTDVSAKLQNSIVVSAKVASLDDHCSTCNWTAIMVTRLVKKPTCNASRVRPFLSLLLNAAPTEKMHLVCKKVCREDPHSFVSGCRHQASQRKSPQYDNKFLGFWRRLECMFGRGWIPDLYATCPRPKPTA